LHEATCGFAPRAREHAAERMRDDGQRLSSAIRCRARLDARPRLAWRAKCAVEGERNGFCSSARGREQASRGPIRRSRSRGGVEGERRLMRVGLAKVHPDAVRLKEQAPALPGTPRRFLHFRQRPPQYAGGSCVGGANPCRKRKTRLVATHAAAATFCTVGRCGSHVKWLTSGPRAGNRRGGVTRGVPPAIPRGDDESLVIAVVHVREECQSRRRVPPRCACRCARSALVCTSARFKSPFPAATSSRPQPRQFAGRRRWPNALTNSANTS
jgi:hypothetical protein